MKELYQTLEAFALTFPETSAGQSCKKTAIKVRKKSFVFLLADEHSCEVMLKLGDSLEEAMALASSDSKLCAVGNTQWVTLKISSLEQLSEDTLKAWIQESFRLLAPKTVLKNLS